MMKGRNGMAYMLIIGAIALLAGCEKTENPVGGANNGMQSVSMSAVFSKQGATSLGKGTGLMSTDSLIIDSAIVIFQRIKFESHIDSIKIDSTGDHDSDDGRDDDNVTLKGPFVVHVRDTSTINFANQVLPAGVYDGIKFKIHRIGWGEHFEDSDDLNRHPRTVSDTTFMGSSIVVWGRVLKNGTWTPFAFHFRGEVEYKLKGNFTVLTASSSVSIVLRFDMNAWFRDPRTGALLDPTDASDRNVDLINWAIRDSFHDAMGGKDQDRDGWPDGEGHGSH